MTNISYTYKSEAEYPFLQFIFAETQKSEEFNAGFILKVHL